VQTRRSGKQPVKAHEFQIAGNKTAAQPGTVLPAERRRILGEGKRSNFDARITESPNFLTDIGKAELLKKLITD
jgi:hypothetical protein